MDVITWDTTQIISYLSYPIFSHNIGEGGQIPGTKPAMISCHYVRFSEQTIAS